MKWYAAHMIVYTDILNGSNAMIPFWENIVLIHATSAEAAWTSANRLGRSMYDDTRTDPDSCGSWDGHPARDRFGGVRRLVECQSLYDRPDSTIGHATEATYLHGEIAREDFPRWLRGEEAIASYDE